MSPWSRETARIVVGPDRVTLLPARRAPSGRGPAAPGAAPQHVPCRPADGSPPWRPALQALSEALPEFGRGQRTATVVLANRFVRYVLVPWSAELANAEEEEAYAAHCFDRVYGAAGGRWVLRLSREAVETPQLASAVDGEMLDSLRAVFEDAGIALRSVQPRLMAVCNEFRARLRRHSGWLALLEAGNLCLAQLDRGRWSSIRNQRIGSAWRDALPVMLEREALLGERAAAPAEVCLWHDDADAAPLPEQPPWRFLRLVPRAARDSAPAQANRPSGLAAG